MSEVNVAEATPPTATPRGTVGYEHKVQTHKYEHAVASIFIQFDVGDDEKATYQNAKDAFFTAKAVVLEQLGVEFQLDDQGVVRALLEQSFGPVVEVVDERDQAPSGAVDVPSGGGTPRLKIRKQLVVDGNKVPAPDWLFDQASSAGCSEVWDNRPFLPEFGGNGNARAPWFKAADGTKDSKSQDYPFWPPKD